MLGCKHFSLPTSLSQFFVLLFSHEIPCKQVFGKCDCIVYIVVIIQCGSQISFYFPVLDVLSQPSTIIHENGKPEVELLRSFNFLRLNQSTALFFRRNDSTGGRRSWGIVPCFRKFLALFICSQKLKLYCDESLSRVTRVSQCVYSYLSKTDGMSPSQTDCSVGRLINLTLECFFNLMIINHIFLQWASDWKDFRRWFWDPRASSGIRSLEKSFFCI